MKNGLLCLFILGLLFSGCSFIPNEVGTAISIYKAVDSAVKASDTSYQSALA
jgi:starvation-inducible outer membrane lipoprotein